MRIRLIVALTLTVAAVAAVLVLANRARTEASKPETGPAAVAGAEQPAAESRSCQQMMAALPSQLAERPRRELLIPAPGVAAWGDPLVILRCGIPTPAELTCSAALQQVNGVAWLQLSGPGQTTYLAADRSVRIALTLPDGVGSAAIQTISTAIAAALPAREVCTDGVLVPATG